MCSSDLIAFDRIDTGLEKVVILSDMNELGEDSPFWHRQIGRFFHKMHSVGSLILMGNMVKWVGQTVPIGLKVDYASNCEEVLNILDSLMKSKKLCILVKGSTFGYTSGLAELVRDLTEKSDADLKPISNNSEKQLQV